MEKHVQNQLMKYFIEHSFVSHEQSAFLKARSTQTSLHRVTDQFLENIDNGELTGVTFFDIKKCFDSIPHHVLLYKLGKYGIKNSEIEWFRNYVQGRTQTVNFNGQLSEKLPINAGIPQGSNLGPLLFLTYINDLNKNLNNDAMCNLFADDTAIYVSGKTVNEVKSKLQVAVNATTGSIQTS